MSNPYSTPYQNQKQPFSGGSPSAEGLVKAPAIALIVVSSIGFLGMLIYLVLSLIAISNSAANLPKAASREEEIGQMIGFYGVFVVMGLNILAQLLILSAGICMLKLKKYTLCLIGSITAGIPFLGSSCCVLGLPFAIWAFVVLMNKDVRKLFR